MGVELDRLDAEIGKLASFAGAGHPITTQIVADLVGLSRERQAWAIQSAIASGDAARAASTLRELLEISRQPEQLVSWAITDLLRKLHAASRLLEEILIRARRAQVREIFLEVRPSNEVALKLYRNYGFHQVASRPAYYQARDGREDAAVLSRVLKPLE